MKRIIIVILLSSLLFSCRKEVEFTGEQSDPLLVVNSIISPDSAIEVIVTKSWFFLDEQSMDSIDDAIVKLYTEDTELSRLNYVSHGLYRADNYNPKPNTKYRIEVEAKGFNKASAEASFPTEIPITDFDTISHFDDVGYLDDMMVGITISDPSNEDNFYRIISYAEAWRWDELTQNFRYEKHNLWINSEDPVISGVENGIWEGSYNRYNIFDDKYLTADSYTIKLKIHPWDLMKYHQDDHFRVTFTLESISEDLYIYLKSRSLHYDNEENPFVEPVPVFSNIENGIGFFGGFSSSSISFDHDGFEDPWNK